MPETQLLSTNPESPDPDVVKRAAEELHRGGVVAFPTETVYGLGADALNVGAVQKVFSVKGRPADNPLIVHVADTRHLLELAEEIPRKGRQLADRFWPGPLTLILPKTSIVPDIVTAGLPTVAVRVPDHPVTLAIIQAFGGGIVGPSANLSGKPSPTQADHVMADLAGMIDVVVDAGPTRIGLESTVVDVTVDPPAILRRGGLSQERLEEVIGPLGRHLPDELARRSPGTRHRHYAPLARVVLVRRGDTLHLRELLTKFREEGKRVGCIVYSQPMVSARTEAVWRVLLPDDVAVARELFRSFRELDSLSVDVILVEEVEERGLGAAVMDRLRRAASEGETKS